VTASSARTQAPPPPGSQRHAAELELSDPEAATAAAYSPEEITFLSALACTNSPSAVTRSTEELVDRQPVLSMIQPIPPPSVSPATPVWVTMPDGTARSNA
jgi:hypothetical protein